MFKSNGRSLNFLFHEPSVFVNPRRLFIDLDFHCTNDGAATTNKEKKLLLEDFTSCLNPLGQGLVGLRYVTLRYVTSRHVTLHYVTLLFIFFFSDSISINLGEALLTRFDQNYSLMTRILYQTEYSRASKKTYLKDFEGYCNVLSICWSTADDAISCFTLYHQQI